MMLNSASTPAPLPKQDIVKLATCAVCQIGFSFTSKTLPPKICDQCRLAKRRAADRTVAERKRRARGVIPLKGVDTPCAKCGEIFVRSNIKHVFCAPCGEANYRARTRKASKEKYATEEGRLAANKWLRDRLRSDPAWRVSASMRTLVHRALGSKKQGKSWRTFVDYSLSELMDHLERKFLPGMTWENYGSWHIDHIIPRKAFSFNDASDPQFKAAWSLDNLQPLWAIDNIRKNAKLPDNYTVSI